MLNDFVKLCFKTITLLVLGIFIWQSEPAQAQYFGLKGGIQQTNIVTDLENNAFGTETGFTIGAFVNIPLPKNFGIGIEGLYAQKIVTQQNAELAQQGELDPSTSLDLGYLEIPVMLQYRIPVAGFLSPRIYGGPVIGVIVNESIDLKGNTVGGVLNEATLLTREAFDDREVGWLAGAGASLSLGSIAYLLLDLRYTGGISTLSDDFSGNPLARQIKIGAFTAMLGLGF